MLSNVPVLKTFFYKEKYYLYSTSTNQLFSIPKNLFSELNVLQEIGLNKYLRLFTNSKEYEEVLMLIRKGIVCKSPIQKIEHPLCDYVEPLLQRGVNFLILQTTKDCNFNCRYCLFSSESSNSIGMNHEKKYMSLDIAYKSVDFLYDHSMDATEIMVSFYGGEPLLNFELIQKVVIYIESLFITKKVQFGLTTNASLLSEKIIDFFIKHEFYITISMDGGPQIQNMHRKFRENGNNTFDIVWENVKRIQEMDSAYFKTHVVFHPVLFRDDNYDAEVNFFNSNNIGSDAVSFTYANTQGIDYYINGSKINAKKNTQMSETAYSERERVFSQKYEISDKWHHNGPCVPGALRLFVDIEGNFYPCEKTDSAVSIGSLDHGFNYEKINDILNIGKYTEDECKICWAKRFCKMCISQCVDIVDKKISVDVIKQQCVQQKQMALEFFKQYIDVHTCSL